MPSSVFSGLTDIALQIGLGLDEFDQLEARHALHQQADGIIRRPEKAVDGRDRADGIQIGRSRVLPYPDYVPPPGRSICAGVAETSSTSLIERACPMVKGHGRLRIDHHSAQRQDG